LLSNEMPIYGAPATRELITPWVQAMVNAVRATGATQPISTGDGAWGIEVTGNDNGYSLREIAPYVDFVGPHVYRMETDVVRQHLMAAFITELAGFTGRPVVLEEFGVTTDFVSAENAAHYYRQVLHNTLLAGTTGWIAWNNTDYDDLFAQEPYSHHAFEMHFGITDRNGTPKTPLLELREFSKMLCQIDVAHCSRPDVDAAILVPSYLETRYPFTEEADRSTLFGTLHQAYVAAREADLPVALAREVDGIPDDVRLLIVPSVKQLTSPSWLRLERLAATGTTVYVSYCAGAHPVQRGPWYADLNGLFGVRHQLVYGLNNPIADDEVEVTFIRDFGAIPAATTLRLRAAGSPDSRAFLPVEADGATVVATDQHGHPVLTVRDVGAGRVVFCTYPIEHMAAMSRAINPEPTYQLYDALADLAGARRPVVVDDPKVGVAQLRHDDGRVFVWFVSQSADDITVKPRLADGSWLRDISTGDSLVDITLPAYGVAVHQLEVDVT
jgi:endo-1,4-beta-mannosidase